MHAYLPKIGGAQITTHCLATSLSEMGHDVVLYANPKLVDSCLSLGWTFNYQIEGLYCPPEIVLKTSVKLWLFFAGMQMKKVIIREKIESVQLVMAWPWLPIANKIKELGVPVFIRSGGGDIQINKSIGYGIRIDPKKNALIESGFRSISKAIAISNTVVNEYLSVKVPRNNIVKIFPGVDFEAFVNCEVKHNIVRKRWKIPAEKKIIISVGRNHPKKGFVDLINALKFLNQDFDKFVVIIVGKNSNNLSTEAIKIGQNHNYISVEEISGLPNNKIKSFPSVELIELYKISNYFVLPSYIETYANVAVEAMAAGVPSICTDAPGCVDTIIDRVDGLIVPTHSPQKIAEAVLELETNAVLRNSIIQEGYAKAKNQDWQNIASKYVDTYNSFLDINT